MMYEGAVYPLPHLVIVLAVESLFRVWPARRGVAMAKAGAVVAAVGFLVAALPLHSRHSSAAAFTTVHDPPSTPITSTWEHRPGRCFWRTTTIAQLRSPPGVQCGTGTKYGAYIGPFLLGIAVLESRRRRGRAPVAPGPPRRVLRDDAGRGDEMGALDAAPRPRLPVQGDARRLPLPCKPRVLVAFSAFVAIAIDRAPLRLKAFHRVVLARYPARGSLDAIPVVPGHDPLGSALVILALLGIGDVLGVGLTRFPTKFGGVPSRTFVPSPRLYLGGRGLARFIDQPEQNRGLVRQMLGRVGLFEAGAALWEGDVPQVRASSPEVATLTLPPTAAARNTRLSLWSTPREPTTECSSTSSYDDGVHSPRSAPSSATGTCSSRRRPRRRLRS